MINLFLQTRQWVLKTIWLVRQSIKISIFFGMLYLAMYMIFPALPGMQFMGLIAVFIWPFLTIFIILFYRTLAENKPFSFEKCVLLVKPKVSNLLLVGFFSFLYAVLLSSLIGSDIATLVEVSKNNQEYKYTFSDFSGIILKLLVLAIPFMMMTWFSPLLIAFKDYSFFKSIKSSFAASLMFLIPIMLSLLAITTLFLISVFVLSAIFAIIGSSTSALVSFFVSFLMIILMAAFMASTFALQSVTFKEIFK
tara:strand:+ start:344 stop:1096 length:753 start_codon:yes stop_codon:yes gene_type:complete